MSLNSRAREVLLKFQIPDHHRDLVSVIDACPTGRLVVDTVDDVMLICFRLQQRHLLYWFRWWEVHRFKRQDVEEAIDRIDPDSPNDGVDVVFERFIVEHERVPVVAKSAEHFRIGADHLGNLIDRTEPSPPMSRAQRRAGLRFMLATGAIFATVDDLGPLIAQLKRAQPPEPWSAPGPPCNLVDH